MTKQTNGYQDRVRRERDELKILIDRLSPFIGSAIYESLPTEEQSRLDEQLFHMRNYHRMLKARITWFHSHDAE